MCSRALLSFVRTDGVCGRPENRKKMLRDSKASVNTNAIHAGTKRRSDTFSDRVCFPEELTPSTDKPQLWRTTATLLPQQIVHSINYIAAVAAVCVLGFPSETNNVIGQVRREGELAISEQLDRD